MGTPEGSVREEHAVKTAEDPREGAGREGQAQEARRRGGEIVGAVGAGPEAERQGEQRGNKSHWSQGSCKTRQAMGQGQPRGPPRQGSQINTGCLVQCELQINKE